MNIDFEKEPIGVGKDGKNVFLRDIWPSSEEVAEVSQGEDYFVEMIARRPVCNGSVVQKCRKLAIGPR